MKILVILAVMTGTTLAQSVHEVPFASNENVLEVTVENPASTSISNVTLRVLQAPKWFQLTSREPALGHISAHQGAVARLSFSIERSAPIGKPEPLVYTILDESGQRWTREMRLSVAPPAEFALFQNYPNPFNPTTTVGYQLAAESKVRLSVYDLLGREVAVLADGTGWTGFHKGTMDASSLSSGMYILRLVATPQGGKQVVKQRTMTVLK